MTVKLRCPYCAERIALWIDLDGGVYQDYVEDCTVCCRPCQVHVVVLGDRKVDVSLARCE